MQSRLANLAACSIAPFTFASFAWPRHVAAMPYRWPLPLRERLALRKAPQCTSDYYHAPRPDSRNGRGFYLNEHGRPLGLRWEWVGPEFGFGEGSGEYRGIVGRLNHGRGFIAGASMGEHMSSFFDPDVYPDEESATHAAIDLARNAAEEQDAYEAEENARLAAEECEE